jgi:hypothetical protein
LFNIGGNQYESFMDWAIFQNEYPPYGKIIIWQTSQPIYRFSGISDYTAIENDTSGLIQVPVVQDLQ